MLPRIHCITHFESYGDETIAVLEAVVRQGVDAVQVRAKGVPDRQVVAFTRSLVDRLAGTPARLIVNDRLDLALAAGAHGVHLGRDDLLVADARRLAPPGFLVGGTCRNADQAREAKAQGADYIGVGPVYPTTTKSGLPDPIGLGALREAARVLPAIAVSGIDAERAPEVMAAGAHGIAVASAICRSPHPPDAARGLVDAVALA
ncbi:thiamine phosphate synthase [Nocardioides pyridinolyticus]